MAEPSNLDQESIGAKKRKESQRHSSVQMNQDEQETEERPKMQTPLTENERKLPKHGFIRTARAINEKKTAFETVLGAGRIAMDKTMDAVEEKIEALGLMDALLSAGSPAICGLCKQAIDHSTIKCFERTCKYRYYHTKCLEMDSNPLKIWFCDSCLEMRKGNKPNDDDGDDNDLSPMPFAPLTSHSSQSPPVEAHKFSFGALFPKSYPSNPLPSDLKKVAQKAGNQAEPFEDFALEDVAEWEDVAGKENVADFKKRQAVDNTQMVERICRPEVDEESWVKVPTDIPIAKMDE